MTLASSGTITSTQIRTELGLAGGVNLVVPNSVTRNLTGRLSGSIVWPNDFWGQTKDGYGEVSDASSIVNTISGVATHAAIPYGATAWNRKIVQLVWWACTTSAVETTISSATIGGIAAAVHVQTGEGGSSASTNYGCAIISATVPAGATGSTVLTFSNATVRRTYLRTYRVTGSNAGPTDVGSGFDEHLFAPSSVSVAYAMTKPANCLMLTAAIISSAGALGGMTCSGNSEEQEFADATFDTRYVAAQNTGLAAGGTTVTISGTAADASRLRSVTAAWALL